MDGTELNNPELQPTVQIIKKSFWQTKKGMAILALGLAIVIFSLLAIGGLIFLPKKPAVNLSSTPVKITIIPENYGFKAGSLTLSCPVESAFCNSQKEVLLNNNNNSALSYKAASESAVLNLTKVESIENIAVLENKKTGKKYFYESTVSKDGSSCYTIAYTLPQDATFGDILNLPAVKNAKIATLGTKTFEIEGSQANVIIQVRNSPIDPGTPCSLIRKSPEFFQAF